MCSFWTRIHRDLSNIVFTKRIQNKSGRPRNAVMNSSLTFHISPCCLNRSHNCICVILTRYEHVIDNRKCLTTGSLKLHCDNYFKDRSHTNCVSEPNYSGVMCPGNHVWNDWQLAVSVDWGVFLYSDSCSGPTSL